MPLPPTWRASWRCSPGWHRRQGCACAWTWSPATPAAAGTATACRCGWSAPIGGLARNGCHPPDGAEVLTRPDDDTPQAMAFRAADVALFRGCGWPGQPHDGGIVHRSPRIAGTGVARLVLVLDAAWPATKERHS